MLAHRGLVGVGDEFLENTVASVARAHAAGVVYVETDCRVTADNVAVMCHDETLIRVLGDARRVSSLTYLEFAELFATVGGAGALSDVLADFPDVRFNVDVKTDDAVEAVGKAVGPYWRRVLITSFSDARRRSTVGVASRYGGVPAQSPGTRSIIKILIASLLRNNRRLGTLFAEFSAIQIPEKHGIVKVLTDRLIAKAHEHGVEVHVWTVNDPARMRQLVSRGVDGIVTDVADVAIATLKSDTER